MNKLVIDYSMGKGRKAAFLLLGVFHLFLGSIGLYAAYFQHLHGVVLAIVILYWLLGFLFLLSLMMKFHRYVIISEREILVKLRFGKKADVFRWKEIKSIEILPTIIIFNPDENPLTVKLSVLSFRDVRRVKHQILWLAQQKNIPVKQSMQIYNR